MEMLLHGIMWYAIFLFSTTLHESAHALAAYLLGDSTAYHEGQVTLDPLPHMRREWAGTILVPILSFLISRGAWMMGWASAPFNPLWAMRYPKRAAMMALAGPLANLLLVLAAWGGIHWGIHTGVLVEPKTMIMSKMVWAAQPGPYNSLAVFLSITFSLNLLLFVFNLLPLPPMDGSTVLYFFISEDTARKLMQILQTPLFSVLGFMAAWLVFAKVFKPVFFAVINLMYPGLSYQPSVG
ncbi:MAG: site-2 protease family protein [Calditrichaeota bacterium]|nr:site-2 protease family protein [Calditrichota bacterium]